MLFHAELRHSPNNCWGREENQQKAREWLSTLDERADEFGVEVLGRFVNPNEHTFYMVLESASYAGISAFLGPPMLTDHEADVTPIVTFEQAMGAVMDREVID